MRHTPAFETQHPWGDADTPFDEIGGESRVRELTDRFYDIVESDSPRLRDMLPANTSTSRVKLYEFLVGWMGGPPLYMSKRGHPRLRMRHLPFAIGDFEAEEWMRCMDEAMVSADLPQQLQRFLTEKFRESALHLRNQPAS